MEVVELKTDDGIAVFRNQKEVIRYEFCKAYEEWISAKRGLENEPNNFSKVRMIQDAWDIYVQARNLWLAV